MKFPRLAEALLIPLAIILPGGFVAGALYLAFRSRLRRLLLPARIEGMKISTKGLEMIKKSEGWRAAVYKDQAGLDTIGYGHLITKEDRAAGRFQKPLTDAEGTALLQKDVERFEKAIEQLVKVQLNQNQFDALVDFTFNLGVGAFSGSTLLKKINAGKFSECAAEFMKWNKIRNPKTGQLEPYEGLTKRRQREADLFASAS